MIERLDPRSQPTVMQLGSVVLTGQAWEQQRAAVLGWVSYDFLQTAPIVQEGSGARAVAVDRMSVRLMPSLTGTLELNFSRDELVTAICIGIGKSPQFDANRDEAEAFLLPADRPPEPCREERLAVMKAYLDNA